MARPHHDVVVLGGGIWLLTRLTAESSQGQLTLAMVVLGIGIGMAMQQYTLVVQNAAERRDLGVATASSQFFRNVGSTVGIIMHKDKDTYRYIPESLKLYPGQRGVRELMDAAGFVGTGFREFGGGIMAINFGAKPL